MAINFDVELSNCGCTLGRTDFFDLVQEVHTAMHPSWSVDELACHPSMGVKYCQAVCQRASANIPEHVIMHALMNARKRPG